MKKQRRKVNENSIDLRGENEKYLARNQEQG